MASTVLVPLAPGAEEMEVVIVVDVLRRAGLTVRLAGLEGAAPVRCSRSVVLVPDGPLEAERGPFAAIVLPGGAGGAEKLAGSPLVGDLLRAQDAAGGLIGAICAAPTALRAHGIGEGKRLTSHPSVAAALAGHGDYREEAVVRDGNLITSRGPGTAFPFALAIVSALLGEAVAEKIRAPMLLG